MKILKDNAKTNLIRKIEKVFTSYIEYKFENCDVIQQQIKI